VEYEACLFGTRQGGVLTAELLFATEQGVGFRAKLLTSLLLLQVQLVHAHPYRHTYHLLGSNNAPSTTSIVGLQCLWFIFNDPPHLVNAVACQKGLMVPKTSFTRYTYYIVTNAGLAPHTERQAEDVSAMAQCATSGEAGSG
jgi:hypothetical protein